LELPEFRFSVTGSTSKGLKGWCATIFVNGRRSSFGPCNSKDEAVEWLNGELASAAYQLDNDFNNWRRSAVDGMAALSDRPLHTGESEA
jgi:hypothetical protein